MSLMHGPLFTKEFQKRFMGGRIKSLLIILIVFLGPGSVIYFISRTVSNHFIILPYVGTQYEYDPKGEIKDSTLFEIPEFTLTRFDDVEINKDSTEGKIIILSTIQNDCPGIDDCGIGLTIFNIILFEKIVENTSNGPAVAEESKKKKGFFG